MVKRGMAMVKGDAVDCSIKTATHTEVWTAAAETDPERDAGGDDLA